MRILSLPVLLVAVLLGSCSPDRSGSEPPEGAEIFVGRLELLDGERIAHSQLKIRLLGTRTTMSPRNYHLVLECIDSGQRFRPPPGEEAREDLWGSFHGGNEEWLGELANPEYQCPAADPARFARIMEILSRRTTLDFQADRHAEFRSSSGTVRFAWEADLLIH